MLTRRSNWRALVLILLFGCGTLISAQQGRESLNYGFVSPNTRDDLKIEEAIRRMDSPEEARLLKEVVHLACVVRWKIRAVRALGSWSDGRSLSPGPHGPRFTSEVGALFSSPARRRGNNLHTETAAARAKSRCRRRYIGARRDRFPHVGSVQKGYPGLHRRPQARTVCEGDDGRKKTSRTRQFADGKCRIYRR